jgi:WhiB family redox-sensing transcriptional regulator
MQKNRANHANQVEHAESVAEPTAKPRCSTSSGATEQGQREPTAADRYAHLAAELDDLAAAPTEVLTDWVAARGRCLWETTFGEPPDWLAVGDPDQELANRLCAGCPVRAECLELELRIAGETTVGVWGGLNVDDRLALLKVWRARHRDEIAALPDDEGWWR